MALSCAMSTGNFTCTDEAKKNMGRSVMVPGDAIQTHYHVFDSDDESGRDWKDHLEDVRNILQDAFPSFETVDRWAGRETHVILENGFAAVGLCEYCGLVSVSVCARGPLGRNWAESIEFVKVLDKAFGGLAKMGTASNGESFYVAK